MKGSLKKNNIHELLTRISTEHKTGILKIRSDKNTGEIHFVEGAIIYAVEEPVAHLIEALGKWETSLQRYIEEMKSHATKGIKEIVQFLKNKIKTEDLRNFFYIETKNTIFNIALYEKGKYEFAEGPTEFDPEIFTLINTDFMNIEATRITDEWRHISGFFPGDETIIIKTDTDINSLTEEPTDAEKRLYSLVDGESPAIEIASRSRIPLLEAKIALSWLTQKQLIVPYAKPAKLIFSWKALRRGVLQGVSSLLLMCLVFISIFISPLNPQRYSEIQGRVKTYAFLSKISLLQKYRISTALEVYRWENGAYPKRLSSLTRAGLLRKEDLTYPWATEYYYSMSGDSYLLLDPRR